MYYMYCLLCMFDFILSTSFSLDVQTHYKVEISYHEIYNERIHDLLASNKRKNKVQVRDWQALKFVRECTEICTLCMLCAQIYVRTYVHTYVDDCDFIV